MYINILIFLQLIMSKEEKIKIIINQVETDINNSFDNIIVEYSNDMELMQTLIDLDYKCKKFCRVVEKLNK
jgi:hypothetical protein